MWNAGSRHVTRDDINTGPISETMKARGHPGHNVVVLASECESPTNASPHQKVQTRSRAHFGIILCQFHSGRECFPLSVFKFVNYSIRNFVPPRLSVSFWPRKFSPFVLSNLSVTVFHCTGK